jgi:hypothetical protein
LIPHLGWIGQGRKRAYLKDHPCDRIIDATSDEWP